MGVSGPGHRICCVSGVWIRSDIKKSISEPILSVKGRREKKNGADGSVLYLFFACSDLVELLVAEIKHEVEADHDEVENIEEEDIPLLGEVSHISFVHELGGDACDIAEEDKADEAEALALCGACLIGFHYIEGPRCAEADDHGDLEEFRHGECFLSFFDITIIAPQTCDLQPENHIFLC